MTPCSHDRNALARRLFDGIAQSYEGPARVFSLCQYHSWHRFLISRIELTAEARVLDVCTGTGLIAMEIARRGRCEVTGLDLSQRMLDSALQGIQAEGLDSRISLVAGQAEDLPFADDSFDVVVFSYLLRYVDDPQATINELVRVLKPGGQMASLEFYIPQGPVLYPLWLAHTRLLMPLGSRLFTQGWREVGSFLGRSISDFYRKHPLQEVRLMWKRAGIADVNIEKLSLGGAVVMWGRKGPASEE
jgi:demethylmenaquinone methyltransferase/2-methoxy-6-polyprenyl-1,4-benzoquinol methylase